MKNLLYLILLISIFSCQSQVDVKGKWQRIEIKSEEMIPEVIPLELTEPVLGSQTIIEFSKDSVFFTLENTKKGLNYRTDKDLLFFLDYKNQTETKWKILSLDDEHLMIERNRRGIDPVIEKVKFKKL